MSECPTCGRDDFKSEGGMKYHHATVHGESLALNTYTCQFCGDEYERYESLNNQSNKNFCSKECEGSWTEEHQDPEDAPRWEGGKATVHCAVCETELKRDQHKLERSDNFFCSTDCEGEWKSEHRSGKNHPQFNSLELNCDYCGDTTLKKPAIAEQCEHHFCSAECQGQWYSENRRGKDAFNWKGGHVRYYGPNWYSQRRSALERDDYECQDCGLTRDDHYEQYDTDLEVHHITPIRTFEDTEAANQLSNLITLCTECHTKREHDARTVEPT